MRVIYWIRRHPLLATGFSLIVGAAPQWVGSVWGLFSSEPLVPLLIRQGVPHFSFSAWWITAPIGLLMFVTVVVIEAKVPFISEKKRRRLIEMREQLLAGQPPATRP